MAKKVPRPKIVPGETTCITTGCGKLYITLNVTPDTAELIEVFCHLGKAGGCAVSQLEAITRLITLCLRYGIPKEEWIKQLANIRCPSQSIDNGIPIYSCADAIAKATSEAFGVKLGPAPSLMQEQIYEEHNEHGTVDS